MTLLTVQELSHVMDKMQATASVISDQQDVDHAAWDVANPNDPENGPLR